MTSPNCHNPSLARELLSTLALAIVWLALGLAGLAIF